MMAGIHNPVTICGKGPDGTSVAVAVDASGNLSGGGGGGGGGGAVTIADGAAVTIGAKAEVSATWYDTAASIIQILKLAVAAFVGAGSRTYTYTSGQLTSETWTLFGTKRTKTYTYTGGVLTGEGDWV